MSLSGLEEFASLPLCLPHATPLGNGDGNENVCSHPNNLPASPNSSWTLDAILILPLTCHFLPSGRDNALVQEKKKV